MPPEERKLLVDMRDSADAIANHISGKTIEDFRKTRLLRSAVYYEFLIIGEALFRLRANNSRIVEEISENGRIIGFRNQIIHGYAKIDDEITWRIIQDKPPILLRELDQLLK